MGSYVLIVSKNTTVEIQLSNRKEKKKMGNKETTLKEIFEDIDTSKDNRVTVEELRNYLNDNDPKVVEAFNNVTLGEFAKFKAGLGFMEHGGDDHNRDGKYSFDEFKSVVESNQDMNEILLKIADAKDDSDCG